MNKVKYVLASLKPFVCAMILLLLVAAVYIIGVGFLIASAFDSSQISNHDVFINAVEEVIKMPSVLFSIQTLWATLILAIFGTWYKKKYAIYKKLPCFEELAPFGTAVIYMFFAVYFILAMLNRFLPVATNDYNNAMNFYNTANVIVYIIIMGPISEEIIFRGLIQSIAKKGVGPKVANAIQALLFGIMHFNLFQGTYAFLMGLYLGYTKERHQTLMVPILLHIIFNSLNYIPVSVSVGLVSALTLVCVYLKKINENRREDDKMAVFNFAVSK